MNDQTDPFSDAFEPFRQRVNPNVGALVRIGTAVFKVERVLDYDNVIGRNLVTSICTQLRVADLQPTEKLSGICETDLLEYGDKDSAIAEKRFAIIKPLLHLAAPGLGAINPVALEAGVNAKTVYRWLKRYREYGGSLIALIPRKRGWKTDKHRIPAFSEAVINEVIETYYLTPQRPSAQKAIVEVQRLCSARGIEAPSNCTIRARLSKIDEPERMRRRGDREKARNKFQPTPGSFPGADFPLSVVQIDHTRADIILVDDAHRKPIGRPWITLAMDIYSRMITGYYLSFDAPSEASVGLCVSHSILAKQRWLALHNVKAQWPVCGVPQVIHVDNGSDFRSDNFRKSCSHYGIKLQFRPVRRPRYGGHIERVFRTLLSDIHSLPGTTFSNIMQKGEYDSAKHATLTIQGFEEWIVRWICEIYHEKIHSSLGMTPRRKWTIGIFGEGENPGVGIRPIPADPETVFLDFLPAFERTIQKFGVTIDDRTYYSERLRNWINSHDPEFPSKKRRFIFRRNPKDISYVWFFDPNLKQYSKIPSSDLTQMPISAKEHETAKKALRKEGLKSYDKHRVLKAITENREKTEIEASRSSKARLAEQRRKENEKNVTPANPLPTFSPPNNETIPDNDLLDGDIKFTGILR